MLLLFRQPQTLRRSERSELRAVEGPFPRVACPAVVQGNGGGFLCQITSRRRVSPDLPDRPVRGSQPCREERAFGGTRPGDSAQRG